ncbi:VOC family protein [Lapillicoccus jejuensis]|uniref:Putative pterin-4-alpha-carbinolamine dehydratase n=1 Tax=Lapillicoccus jejuensis TaxID=402171 RepID=A0A542DY98_9MICO|nr:VOC family protein [Lapillicoccus jejuensis]TQJ08055.1 4a-hydroxytetrahydrobiopterin dehydratase [Lapillicoccus jejuensis]
MTDESRETVLTARDVEAADLPDWRMLFDRLHASYDTGDFAAGARLVAAVAAAAEEAAHHPALDLAYGRLDVRLHSHDAGGVTARDVALARRVSALAHEAGAAARPDRLSVLELALDAVDASRVRPFWAALLDAEVVEASGELQLQEATGRIPTVWFQPTDPHATPRQRWHLDLRIAPEVVQDRIAAAVAAGGTVVDDGRAPAFWVLADPEGNRACLTTWEGRGE